MNDEHDHAWMQPGVYDDDRLLACALGLEDDPELVAAAASDATLAARLEAMRADVTHIGAQVSAAVPEPDESYTDLSGERWGGLREFFETPAAPAPRRERRWWQVVAPVAAVLVVALLVGIVALNGGIGGGSGSATSDSGTVARTEADGGSTVQSFSGDETPGSDKSVSSPTLRERFADQMDRFAVVVLARARQVSGAVQRFAVLRIFKGQAPKVVELAVGDEPADQGRLHVLMLDPTAEPVPEPAVTAGPETTSPWPLTESPVPGVTASALSGVESPLPDDSLAPEPIPSLAAVDGPGEPLDVSYLYDGEPVMVRELAAGTDPDSVTIPLP